MGASKMKKLYHTFSEVGEIARVLERAIILATSGNTSDNYYSLFIRLHCDYLLITKGKRLLSFWVHKTVKEFGQGYCSFTLLNLPGIFFHLCSS